MEDVALSNESDSNPERIEAMLDKKPLILIVEGALGSLTSLYSALDGPSEFVATCRTELDARKFVAVHPTELVILGELESGQAERLLVQSLRKISPSTRILVLVRPGDRDGRGADATLAWPASAQETRESVDRLLEAVSH